MAGRLIWTRATGPRVVLVLCLSGEDVCCSYSRTLDLAVLVPLITLEDDLLPVFSLSSFSTLDCLGSRSRWLCPTSSRVPWMDALLDPSTSTLHMLTCRSSVLDRCSSRGSSTRTTRLRGGTMLSVSRCVPMLFLEDSCAKVGLWLWLCRRLGISFCTLLQMHPRQIG